MPRYQNPADINFYQGEPVPNGKLFFFESRTSTPKATFADVAETVANEHGVQLDSAGREPNIFYNGSAKVILQDEFGQQVWERDPVGGESILGNYSEYNPEIIYNIDDIVQGADGSFYISQKNNNQNNDPTTDDGSNWVQLELITYYTDVKNYQINSLVRIDNGDLYRAVVGDNVANPPQIDDGSHWLPSVNGSQLEAVISLEARTTTPVVHVGGGSLVALRDNEIRDASAYVFPAANSIGVNQTITINIPDEYKALMPVVTTAAGDTISYSGGTDTSITFDAVTSISLTLTSDGVSNWTL